MARLGRERLAGAFSGLIQSGNSRSVVSDAASYFQQASISGQDFLDVFGNEEDFLKRYSQFENRYFSELENQIGHIRGGRATLNMMRKRGNIDLSLLDHETSSSLSMMFKREVMRVEQLFQHAGLPAFEMPSANLYRYAFKFDVDNTSGIRHPAQILLNSMIFNFNPDKSGLESINLNTSNILGSKNLGNVWNTFKSAIKPGIDPKKIAMEQFKPFGNMREGQRILMFDTETTGVDVASQVRSMSLREIKIGANGEIEYDMSKPIFGTDLGFKSPKLAGYRVADLNGGSRSLNEFISNMEKVKSIDMGPEGIQFLDEATKFINTLLGADKIAGHNIGFDIRMLTDSMAAQSAFGRHKEAQEAVNNLIERINKGNYVVDTLESTRAYLQNQVAEVIQNIPGEDVAKRTAAFTRNILAQETLAKVHLGGGFGYASVENIALNTNLFELIEKDGQAEYLFETLKRGPHIAETDVHLQSFISKYVQRGDLKIRALYEKEQQSRGIQGSPYTDFGRWARSIVNRASAITPTTNMASVEHLHRTALDYLTSEAQFQPGAQSRLTGFTLRLQASDIKGFDVQGLAAPELEALRKSEGFLSFSEGNFVFTTARGSHKLTNQESAARTIIDVITDAAGGDRSDELMIRQVKLNTMRNRSAESIVDTGISYARASRITELAQRGRLQVGTSLDINDISNAMGIVYQKLGTGLSAADQTRYLLGRDIGDSVFQGGIREFDTSVDKPIAEAFARIGDPFAQAVDARSRMISTIMAQSTAEIAAEAGQAAKLANAPAEVIAHTAHAALTSGLGVSYFRSQEVTRIFDIAAESNLASSRMLVPQAIFKEAQQRAGLADQKVLVGFSKARHRLFGTRINVVADVQAMGRQNAEKLARSLVEVMKDTATIGKLSKDQIPERTAADMATVKSLSEPELEKSIQSMIDSMMDRGIGIGQIGGAQAKNAERNLAAAGFDLSNDVRATERAVLLDSGLTNDYIAISPVMDPKAAEIALGGDLIDEAAESVQLGNNTKISRVLKVKGDYARTIDETEGAAQKLKAQLLKDRYGLPDNKLLSYYVTHKTGIKATALGVAAVGLGYLAAKKYRESKLYDETLAQQPTQVNRGQVRSANQNTTTNFAPLPMDPLATAGVVGNLDRMKIGHTQMGNNKYNHLFGG